MDATSSAGSVGSSITFKRRQIFDLLRNVLMVRRPRELMEYLEQELSRISNIPVTIPKERNSYIYMLIIYMKTKWKKALKREDNFFFTNKRWLDIEVPFCPRIKEEIIHPSSIEIVSLSKRPSKRQRSEDLQETLCTTSDSLDCSDKIVVHCTTSQSLSKSSSWCEPVFHSKVETTLSGNAALALLVETKLTRHQYNGIRSLMKEKNCKLYPNYKVVLEATKLCYPPRSSITITKTSAEIKLQDLLDHTCTRILLAQAEVIRTLNAEAVKEATLICKWGYDGDSGQSQCKQNFSRDCNDSNVNIFSISLVPLQIVSGRGGGFHNETAYAIWVNPRPSSTRFCRPIGLQFNDKAIGSALKEVADIEEQIASLGPLETVVDGKSIKVNYEIVLTIFGEKVCDPLASTRSIPKCHLCGASSEEFNDIDFVLQKEVNVSNLLHFGMSIPHAWICLFECLLDLSYNLGIKQRQPRNDDEKKLVAQRTAIIQKGLKSQLGLNVDHLKPGYGNTRDADMARRFFEHSTSAASITGLNARIVERFHVILQAISSGRDIKVENYGEYALESARMFVATYSWYNMPTMVHELLIHAPQIIVSALLLPMGQLSKEVREVHDDCITKYQESSSLKCFREKKMQNVLNRLLVSSDPYISTVNRLAGRKLKSLSAEAVDLLLNHDASFIQSSGSDSDSD